MFRRIRFTILMLLLASTGFSQLDVEHFLPPLTSSTHKFIGGAGAGYQVIYLSTPSADPVNYTIYDGAGAVLYTGSVSNGTPKSHGGEGAGAMHGLNTPLFVNQANLNKALTNRGVRVVADAPIYCNLRVRSPNNAQAASITAKGRTALGTTFRLGHIPTPQKRSDWGLNSLGSKLATIGFYATEDNTTITVDLTRVKPLLWGPGAPNTNAPFTITLDKGECYVMALRNQDAPNRNAGAGFSGGLVTSDKPIAVNCASMGGYMTNTWQADYGADQIVPIEEVGTKYAVVRGASNDNGLEQVMIVAHENGTEIKVNGTVVKTLNAGQIYKVHGSKYVNGSMFIETSKPAYAYQMMMGSNGGDKKTPGMNFIPPISCKTSNYVDNIPLVHKIGNVNYKGAVSIVTTKTGSGIELFINGVKRNDKLGTAKNVPGSDYKYYKISNLTGNVAVRSNTIALVSFTGYNGAAGFGGYFSGWQEGVVEDSLTCLPGHIFELSGRYDSYRWFKDGVEIPGEVNDSLFATETGYYQYEYTKGTCVEMSDSIYAVGITEFELEGDTNFCPGEQVEWEIVGSGFDSISWNNGAVIEDQLVTIDTAGLTPIRIYSDITQECYIDTTVPTIELPKPTVTLRDTSICIGESVTLDAGNAGATFKWNTLDETQTVDLNSSGEYKVVVTNPEGCKDSATMNLSASSCNLDAEVTKSDFTDKYYAGATTIYTIVARNFGPSDVVDGDISDPLPTGILAGDVTWTATPFGGATTSAGGVNTGALTDEVNIPAGDSIVYTVNVVVPPDFVGDLVNTVTITVDNDTFPDNDVAVDTDTKDCNFQAQGTINSRTAGWVKMGNVVMGIPYTISPAGGSKTFVPTNGPEKGETITTLVYNTGTGNHVSLTRNRYRADNEWFSTITSYDNTPHAWTGLSGSGSETAPILGFMAFIDQNRNGKFDSGLETYYRDITSLKFTPTTSGELYMAFYDDGVYTDNAGTITVNVESELESTDIGADTAICVGETVTLDAQNPDAASWVWSTGETTQTIVADTTGEYSVKITSVGGCEVYDTINLVVHPCNIDLGVTKTDGREDYTPGTTTEYTIVVTNYGPYDAVDVTINDPAPVGITTGDISWDVTAYGGATSGATGSHSGILNDLVSIPVGDSVVYSVNIAVPGNYKGDLINVVTISHPLDTNSSNDTAEDIDFNGLCVGSTVSSFAEQFNTGVKINPGENDPNWKIQWINDPAYYVYSANNYATPISDAVIPAVGMNKAAGVWADASYPDYLWVCYPWTGPNNGPGKHVDVDGDGNIQEYDGGRAIVGTGDAVLLKFSKTFEMTASQLEASEITFDIAADNHIMDIIVNGVSQGPKALSGYTLHPHTITQDFQLGSNTVEIVVNSGPGFAGMMIANSTIKAVDSVSLMITDPPLICAPNKADITDSLWTIGSINADSLIYFADLAAIKSLTNPTRVDSGTYTIVAINKVGCADTAQIYIGQNPIAEVELMPDTAFCLGGEVTINAGDYDSIVWSTGDITPSITVDSTNEYKVVVYNEFKCSDSDSVTITVHDLPVVTTRDTTICPGGTATFEAVSTTATDYLWRKTGSGTTPSITGSTVGMYEVIVTDVNGCKDTAEAELIVHVAPEVTVDDNRICIGDPAATFTATSATAASYLWSENGSGTAGTTSGTTAGNYTVVVTDANTCKDTATAVLIVDTLPIVSVEDTVICSNISSVDLTAVSSTAMTYNWSGTGTGSASTITAITAGNYVVTVTDENGCINSDDANVYIVEQPEPFEILGDLTACEGDEIDLSIDVTAEHKDWDTGEEGDGITVTQDGNYSVTIANEAHGLRCEETQSVDPIFLPYAEQPEEPYIVNCFDHYQEIPVTFETSARIDWGDLPINRDNAALVTEPGFYSANIYLHEQCQITAELEVEEFCPYTVFIPNAFTPNDDGINETFVPKVHNIIDYKLYIFNRWGELIFTSNHQDNQWDGTYMGNPAQIDVYVYKLTVTGNKTMEEIEEQQFVGTVSLIR